MRHADTECCAHSETNIRKDLETIREELLKFEQRHGSDVHKLNAEINVLKGIVVSEIRDLKHALMILIQQKQNHKPAEPESVEIQKEIHDGILVCNTASVVLLWAFQLS